MGGGGPRDCTAWSSVFAPSTHSVGTVLVGRVYPLARKSKIPTPRLKKRREGTRPRRRLISAEVSSPISRGCVRICVSVSFARLDECCRRISCFSGHTCCTVHIALSYRQRGPHTCCTVLSGQSYGPYTKDCVVFSRQVETGLGAPFGRKQFFSRFPESKQLFCFSEWSQFWSGSRF